MSENEKKVQTTEEKMKELFDLMDAKAAAGELVEVEDDEKFDEEFKKEMEEAMTPMSASEVAGIEYSMMMNQYEAMLADWERREAEEKAAEAAAKKAEQEDKGE
ncbi:hypothetical protein [Evtepia sp.]|uniref:hypothetical protein n=1 Tax=Evtepia sp. TaxID=2773933 RepID=UPI003F15B328